VDISSELFVVGEQQQNHYLPMPRVLKKKKIP